jgi:hypothetical protein
VLSLAKKQPIRGLPKAADSLNRKVAVENLKWELNRLHFEGPAGALGPDWTSPMPAGSTALLLDLRAEVTLKAPAAELLVLSQASQEVTEPAESRLQVDDKEVAMSSSSSAAGWAATGQPVKEHWLFLKGPLPGGHHQLALKLLGLDPRAKLSAWVWATKPGGSETSYPNALPSPETVSLDAQPLLSPVDATATKRLVRSQRPVEKIDGVFLDALEPASSVQGWGKLQRNQSVWEKPITIAGRHFRRGLGTHADSRIAYDIGGRYRRFQSWVGADGASHATITFEVWADGRKQWESGPMTWESPPRWVDIDISGVKTLDLVVGHGGDDIASDHADWAEARVLR